MQTLKAYLRDGASGPGVMVSLPMPPVGKPIPRTVRFAGVLYDHRKVLCDAGLLYLRRRSTDLPDDEAEAFDIMERQHEAPAHLLS